MINNYNILVNVHPHSYILLNIYVHNLILLIPVYISLYLHCLDLMTSLPLDILYLSNLVYIYLSVTLITPPHNILLLIVHSLLSSYYNLTTLSHMSLNISPIPHLLPHLLTATLLILNPFFSLSFHISLIHTSPHPPRLIFAGPLHDMN